MMERIKICFLQYSLRGGGAERKVCTLANYFANNGCDVEIGIYGVNEIAYTLDEKVKLTFIDRSSYAYNNRMEQIKYQLKEKIESFITAMSGIAGEGIKNRFSSHYKKKNNYTDPIRHFILNRQDTVFITMMVSNYLEILRIMAPYWKDDIPVPYLVMDCSDPKKNADAQMDHKRTENYPRAARVLVMTQEAKNYFSQTIQKKCVIIPNPVRDDLPEPYEGERRKVVVDYCRLNRQKNLPLLINAFAEFNKKFPEYSLEIYGEGELLSQLQNQIIKLELEKKASIHPFNPQIHHKIRDCAMFVSSSDWEGFPNTVLEALCLGIPVISTDCDFGPRDMINDHENGILVPVGDTNALAEAMCEIAANPAKAAEMGRKAIHARDIYAPHIIGQKWLELIQEVKREYQ